MRCADGTAHRVALHGPAFPSADVNALTAPAQSAPEPEAPRDRAGRPQLRRRRGERPGSATDAAPRLRRSRRALRLLVDARGGGELAADPARPVRRCVDVHVGIARLERVERRSWCEAAVRPGHRASGHRRRHHGARAGSTPTKEMWRRATALTSSCRRTTTATRLSPGAALRHRCRGTRPPLTSPAAGTSCAAFITVPICIAVAAALRTLRRHACDVAIATALAKSSGRPTAAPPSRLLLLLGLLLGSTQKRQRRFQSLLPCASMHNTSSRGGRVCISTRT